MQKPNPPQQDRPIAHAAQIALAAGREQLLERGAGEGGHLALGHLPQRVAAADPAHHQNQGDPGLGMPVPDSLSS